jgi:hypothetical protein
MSMYSEFPASYPAKFMLNVKKLSGGMNRQTIKVLPDRTTCEPNGIMTFRMPLGAIVDLESLMWYFKVTDSGTSPLTVGRNASNFIKRLSVNINNVSTMIINDYNLVHNIYSDLHNKNQSKAFLSNPQIADVEYSEGVGGADIVAITAKGGTKADITGLSATQFVVDNWIGILNSISTPIVNTDLLGEVSIQIQIAPLQECVAMVGGDTYSNETFSITDSYMTIQALSFTDDSYYQSLSSRENLYYTFNDYIVTRFASVAKNTGINVTNYISAGSIDHILGTAVFNETTPTRIVNYFGDGDGATAGQYGSLSEVIADKVGKVDSVGTSNNGDLFNNLKALQRNLQHLDKSVFSINNKQLNYSPLNIYEVYQNNLTMLNNLNIDASSNGFHEGVLSIYHFFKYYGFHLQALNLDDPDVAYISGLNTSGASASINWDCKFTGSGNTLSIVPVMITKLTKVLKVGRGRQISVY